ncbi:DUF6053 domain-containing protein [Lysobacter enzymogenes]|uniref:DUF6053 domain-containing protein n=1 Tax=Lysobacter enzymogenes TaxID=69 RepID=UPI00339421F5
MLSAQAAAIWNKSIGPERPPAAKAPPRFIPADGAAVSNAARRSGRYFTAAAAVAVHGLAGCGVPPKAAGRCGGASVSCTQ